MLGQNGDDDGRILRTLALVNGCGVCRNQRVKLAEAIGDGAPVEMRGQLAVIGIDIVDIADVAVINLLVIIVWV